ncbi:MAG: gliding motility-associated C-terminal domain-containing protein [Bacteroidota bacterium]
MKTTPKKYWLLALFYALSIASALATTNTDPPTITPPPNDTTVACLTDIPPQIDLLANDDTDTSFPKMISPVDTPDSTAIDICAGGTITRTWTATDMDGFSRTVSQTITILPDNTPPVVSVPEVQDTVACDTTVPEDSYATWINARRLSIGTNIGNAIVDDCSGIMTFSDDAPSTFEASCSTLVVSFTITDECGLSTLWQSSYTTFDTIAPIIDTAPMDTTVNCEAVPMPAMITATDNCANITPLLVQDTIPGACANAYTLQRTWIAADGCGNADTTRQTLFVIDTIAPVLINAPSEDTLYFACADEVPAVPAVTASDNCATIVPQYTQDSIAGNCINAFTLQRTWIATDGCGNADTVQQVIVVADTIAPVLANAPTIDTLYLECPEDVPAEPLVTASDNCSIVSPSFVVDTTFGGFCPQGNFTINRLWTVADECGLTDTARQVIIVQDTIGPSLIGAPNDTLVLDCNDPIPDPPFVSVENSNCSLALIPTFTADTIPDGNCPSYRFTIIRTWLVADICAKGDTARQVIQVSDTQAPSFTVPPNITISCDDDPEDLNITGNVINVMDNCDPNPTVVYQDQITMDGGCPQAFTIRRTWRVIDECNNVTGKNQTITIVDDQAPTFTVPADITVSCGEEENLGITGIPTNINDNCDQGLSATFDDTIIPGSCVNNFVVRRLWNLEDDCGNFTELLQSITVVDNQIPNFTTAPQNVILECDLDSEVQAAFDDWIDSNGGAIATDNCSAPAFLTWFAFFENTSDPATLPPHNCPSPGGVTRDVTIDFVVVDECGNQSTSSARFRVIDTTPPAIIDCPSDTFAITDPGSCNGTYTFFPPVVEENCGASLAPVSFTDTQPIVYTGTGDPFNEPADPITYTFDLASIAPVSIASPVTLSVQLENADAESPEEYFIVRGEDGTMIGQTTPTNAQCGASNTVLSITAEQANAWSADGQIIITLEPFIPSNQSGAFAINALCTPQGEATVSLAFDNRDLSDLTFEYQFNDAPRVTINANGPIQVGVDAGQNILKYFVTDCAGNVDSCSYNIEIRDEEAPVISCALPINLPADTNSCVAAIELPAPMSVSDNCAINANYLGAETATSDMASSMLTFAFNPNLPGYLAEAKTYDFNGFGTDVTADVTLDATFQGDFNTDGAFFTLTGENGFVLGTTMVGAADCSTQSQMSFVIPAAQFNDWNADGTITITATPNPTPIPPPFPDSGINPCDPSVVNADGDTDGISFLQLSISISFFRPFYYAEGASPISLSQFPATGATPPTFYFGVGETSLFYIIADEQENLDTCEVPITIVDEQLPVAECVVSTIVELNPANPDVSFIDPEEINNNSSDNCGIDSLFILNNGFTCNFASDTMTVTLVVRDSSGNESACQSLVRFENTKPAPDYNGGLCAGDSLFLFTNPPATGTGEFFLYEWSGPDGFSSDEENPFIPNASPDNAGTYTVTITGITGCSSSSSVFIDIADLPTRPTLLTSTQYCDDETIELFTTAVGSSYQWTKGLGMNAELLATTSEPFFNISPPLDPESAFYSVVIETSAGCLSERSEPIQVTVTERPEASVSPTEIIVCEGEQIVVSSPVTGADLSYAWQGPFNFNAFTRVAVATDSATVLNSGVYELVVSRNGCASQPAEVIVTVLPRPPRPTLFYSGDVCEGEGITFSTSIENGETYVWQSENGDFTTDENSLTIDAATLGNGGTWQVLVNRFGCPSESSVPLEVEVFPIPPTEGSISPPAACEGEMIQLSSTPLIDGASYIWVAPNGDTLAGPSHQIMNADLGFNGEFELTITSPQGCAKTDFVQLEILPTVSVTAISSNAPSCLQGPTDVELSASVFPPDDGSYLYFWSTGTGFQSFDPVAVIPGATAEDSDNYTLVVTTADGCSSAEVTIPLTLTDAPATPDNPETSPGGQLNFCLGDDVQLEIPPYSGIDVAYNWFTPNGLITTSDPSLVISNSNPLDSGAYRVQVLVDGCSSDLSGITIIDVNEVPVVTASSNSPVCEGETIQLSSSTTPGSTFSWTGPITSSNQNPQIIQADSIAHDGSYMVIADFFGCQSEPVLVDVVVNTAPEPPSLISNGPICSSDAGATLVLSIDPASATPGGTYTWSDENGPISGALDELSFSITDFSSYGENDTYLFFANSTRGECSSNDSDPIAILINTAPDQEAVAGSDTTLCLNDFLELEANTPNVGVGSWTVLDGPTEGLLLATPNQASTNAEGLISGIYNLQWSLSNGVCIDYAVDTLQINVSEGEPAVVDEDFVACFFDEVAINALPPMEQGSVGFWSQDPIQEDFGVSLTNSDTASTMVSGLVPGGTYFFTWTVVSECGEQTDELTITISDPFPEAGDDQLICDGSDLASLGARMPLGSSTGSWSSPTPGVSISNTLDTATTVFDLAIGENLFVWTIDDGICGEFSRDTMSVFFYDTPDAVDDQVAVDFGETVKFNVLDNDNVPPGAIITEVSEPNRGVLRYLGDGEYEYTASGNFAGSDEFIYEACTPGCECAQARVFLGVDAGTECKIPNIFTPNNDGVNDFFIVPCLANTDLFPNSQVIIFNRWGDEVFRSAIPYQNDWNGTFDGEDLPTGTYFYIVDAGNGGEPINGYIVLQR